MTILGSGGFLTFHRPPPAPLLLPPNTRRPDSATYQPSQPTNHTGDLITLSGEYPLPPEYETCFLHRDVLNRLSLYPTKASAQQGLRPDRLPLPPPECGTLTLTTLTPATTIQAVLGEWTLHLDPIFLNHTVVERQLGAGMINLCTGGGSLSFQHTFSSPGAPPPEIALIVHQLNSFADLAVDFHLLEDLSHPMGYRLEIKPLSYVLNARTPLSVQGTLEFASFTPISLLHL